MARDDDETSWPRQLLLSVVVLAVVALVVGGVVGLVALGAARVAGIGEPGSGSSAKPSLYLPSYLPTTKPLRSSPPAHSSPARGPRGRQSQPGKKSTHSKHKGAPSISLKASPSRVAAGQRINLTGRYPGGSGARLQVQRLEGGSWSDFPVDVTVHGRMFATYVVTSHSGVNRFRVLDTRAGRHSNPVRVTVG